jgi:predicted Zn-dependent protease
MVDPSALLLTGLTRDGVYQIKHGEIVGAVRNYRWNVSPLTLLNQITAVSESEIAQPREWADDISRIKAPAMTFTGFNMSTQSPAN